KAQRLLYEFFDLFCGARTRITAVDQLSFDAEIDGFAVFPDHRHFRRARGRDRLHQLRKACSECLARPLGQWLHTHDASTLAESNAFRARSSNARANRVTSSSPVDRVTEKAERISFRASTNAARRSASVT